MPSYFYVILWTFFGSQKWSEVMVFNDLEFLRYTPSFIPSLLEHTFFAIYKKNYILFHQIIYANNEHCLIPILHLIKKFVLYSNPNQVTKTSKRLVSRSDERDKWVLAYSPKNSFLNECSFYFALVNTGCYEFIVVTYGTGPHYFKFTVHFYLFT